MRNSKYPKPITNEPDMDELEEMLEDGIALATDGCEVEATDGICEHGYPSWILYLGYD